jgi:predicted nucleic acid-binding protein
VNRVVLLDTGIIGLITNPKRAPESLACNCWLQILIKAAIRVIRELLRANKIKGIKRLDELANLIEYLAITTDAMGKAALFWAQARQQGQPTAGDKTIDGDMILIAQAVTLSVKNLIIVTTNVGHLSKFVRADLWQNISFD